MVQVLSEGEPEMVEADVLVEEASQALKEGREQWLAGEKAEAEIKALLALKVREVFWAELEISSNNLIREEGDESVLVFVLSTFRGPVLQEVEMNREEILAMDEERLLDLVHEEFNVALGGLEDAKYLSVVWGVVEKLEKKGWAIDIRVSTGSKSVDGYKFEGGGPGTIFAQYGHRPNFRSITEGICKTALIACEKI